MGIPIKNAMNKMIRTVRGDTKIIAMVRAPTVWGGQQMGALDLMVKAQPKLT
jgi:hypothetical protein